MKYGSPFISCFLIFLLFSSCGKVHFGPANLVVSDVQFTETKSRTFLDAPASFSQIIQILDLTDLKQGPVIWPSM